MKLVSYLALLIIAVGCSSTQLKSTNPNVVAQKICLNNEGRGRLTVNQKKYVFTYFSALEKDDSKWILGLSFPFQDEEVFELDWSENQKMKFNTSIDSKILKENSNINPTELELFINSIGLALKDVIKLKNYSNQKLAYNWNVNKNSFIGTSKARKMKVRFDNLVKGHHFGLIELEYVKDKDQSFKFEFILSECFEKEALDSKA